MVSDKVQEAWERESGIAKYKTDKKCKKCGSSYFYKHGNCVRCKTRYNTKYKEKKRAYKNGITVSEAQERRRRIEEHQNRQKDDEYGA